MENKKTTINIITCLLLLSAVFCGCEDVNITAKPTSKGGEVRTENGIFTQVRELNEFEYKEHTYISCSVRDGISLTHAGHCKCNN
jgi:hypothetical protein